MEFRSTNDNGYSHIQGDFVTNVSSGGPINSSHGVMLSGGSTGGVVTAAGDETNIALRVLGKGAGPLVLGGVNSPVTLNSTSLTVTGGVTLGSTNGGITLNSSASQIGSASTTGIAMIQRYRIDWTVPALSSAGLDASFGDSTITLVGATTNSIFLFQERVNLNSTNSTGIFVTRVRCSTADELRLTVANCGASTISGSTMSGYLLQFKF